MEDNRFQSKNISTDVVNNNPKDFLRDLDALINKIAPMVDTYCGKCAPCRVGNKRLLERVIKLEKGKVSKREILGIVDLSKKIIESCLCLLGRNEPNLVLEFVEKYFVVSED